MGQNCECCGGSMNGIRAFDPVLSPRWDGVRGTPVRLVCEPCGGNTTQYNKQNPIPHGSTWLHNQRERLNGKRRGEG